jgi:hypothetical protein
MTITTQPTAVSLVQLTRQLNSELSIFLTCGDNPNPNPTRDRRQSGSPNSPPDERNIIRGKRSMRCHTAWKMIPTYISTVHASLSLHVVLHTTVLLYTARNCHDEIVRQLPKATGIAGASRREDWPLSCRREAFFGFCSRVAST